MLRKSKQKTFVSSRKKRLAFNYVKLSVTEKMIYIPVNNERKKRV